MKLTEKNSYTVSIKTMRLKLFKLRQNNTDIKKISSQKLMKS